jgi:PTH2 family peptidyl-tRNA hydrolase
MKDHNSAEAREERASQEDPIVMYLIVHETLGMSMGKTAAQCAHASQMLTLDYFETKDKSRALQKKILETTDEDELHVMKALYAEQNRKLSVFGEWLQGSFRKVVLRADDKEWAKIQKDYGNHMIMVVDAGLTEIAAGSETVIGLWPMRKSQRPKTIQRLQVLK